MEEIQMLSVQGGGEGKGGEEAGRTAWQGVDGNRLEGWRG